MPLFQSSQVSVSAFHSTGIVTVELAGRPIIRGSHSRIITHASSECIVFVTCVSVSQEPFDFSCNGDTVTLLPGMTHTFDIRCCGNTTVKLEWGVTRRAILLFEVKHRS